MKNKFPDKVNHKKWKKTRRNVLGRGPPALPNVARGWTPDSAKLAAGGGAQRAERNLVQKIGFIHTLYVPGYVPVGAPLAQLSDHSTVSLP